MIPNQWYPILIGKHLKADKPLGVRRCGVNLVLWRKSDGTVACIEDRCQHKGAALSVGRVNHGQIECRYHGARYDALGRCVALPCVGEGCKIPKGFEVRGFPVREAHELIWLWWGEERAEYPALKTIPEISENDDVYHMMAWDQPVHYTRYIASLLEFHHVPFTHREGLFNLIDYIHIDLKHNKPSLAAWTAFKRATKVDSLKVWTEWDDQVIRSKFYIVRDDMPERRATEYNIAFQFPCTVFVNMPEFRAGILMIPIDDDNTHTIFRWYEYKPLKKYLKVKPLRMIYPVLANYCAKYIQDKEDIDVILTQQPKIADVGVNKLTAADEMDARYLALRHRFKKEGEEQASPNKLLNVV